MFARFIRFPVLVGAVAVLAGASVAVAIEADQAPAAVTPVVARPSGPAAPFDLRALQGGGTVSLGAATGQPVILSFFASWCDGCRQELGTMAGLARSGAGSVEVIGIDVNDDSGAARSLLAADHITYPVGTDSDGNVASRYDLGGLPTTVYLDAHHRIVGRTLGPLSVGQGRAWMAALEGRTAEGRAP
jgi:cytochrome c biogenesis protein CcmG/thiol:disulfide interchange protein DsbE